MFTMNDMILLLPALILSVYAQWKVSSTFKKMSERRAASGLTGAQVARMLLQRNGIDDVKVETVPGSLSDHYDPTQKVLRLSEPVYDSNSLAALGVAAHETGHAIQHHTAYSALSLRSAILPMANIGSKLAIPLFLGGMLMRMDFLITIGIVLFIGAVAFTLVTLPVEFNASRRAMAQLTSGGFLRNDEIQGAKSVLDAAALTYVAAAAMAVVQLIRLIMIRNHE
ncbi:MAG TPA: zinc metallopeptidase [bacterium]|nr:zinc metallopeptidase [bacterium]